MYDDIAEKLFVLVTQKRQYKFYIENLKLYPIPNSMPLFSYPQGGANPSNLNLTSRFDKSTIVSQPSHRGGVDDLNASFNTIDQKASSDAEKFYDIRYYNELMDSVPPEYISTSVMLHCMVEQVKLSFVFFLKYNY